MQQLAKTIIELPQDEHPSDVAHDLNGSPLLAESGIFDQLIDSNFEGKRVYVTVMVEAHEE